MGRMKKERLTRRTAAPKYSSPPKTVDEYLARVPATARAALCKMRATIQSVLPPDASETISYRIPAFKSSKGVVVWFAAFSDHLSLFPTASVIAAFKDGLKSFYPSKGTIHFPVGKPLPVALIKRLVKTRVAQLESK